MDYMNSLNKEQLQAVNHDEGPLLILAGAGTGKTRVITARIANLIQNRGVDPYNILAVTFTNKAAGEMKERVENMLGGEGSQVFVSTFHSFCVRMLRRYIDNIGYTKDFSIYDTDDKKSVIKGLFKKHDIDKRMLSENRVANAISHAKDNLISVKDMMSDAQYDSDKQMIAKLYSEYQNTLIESNALDFDDLIMKTVELFRCCPEVLNNVQNRFKYILVDEYQDTNLAQFELVRLLAGSRRNLCVVGDDDQSIYKFRGANIRNILDFEAYFEDTKVIRLEQNYRSCTNILNASNAVIAYNKARKGKNLWSAKPEGEKVFFRQYESSYEEADAVVSEIAKKRRDGWNYNDFAILYRTNAQSRLLEERLIMRGMPYTVVGSVNFYSRAEIKDVLAYLKMIDNGQDELALRRIINVPKRGIGDTTLAKVVQYCDYGGIGLFEGLCDVDRIDSINAGTRKKINDFTKLIYNEREKLKTLDLPNFIGELIDDINYTEYLEENDEETADDRIENINELRSKAALYAEEHPEATLSDFLSEVSLVSDLDSLDEEQDKLTLMTIHAAKGLEFNHVYLTGLEDGLFPSYASITADDSETEIEEERRLMYVAMTRAKETLSITAARMRMMRGETQMNSVSRFVREIPSEYLKGEVPKKKVPDFLVDSMNRYNANNGEVSGLPKQMNYFNPQTKPYGQINKTSEPAYQKPVAIKRGSQLTVFEPDYGVGDRIKHVKFGTGTVVDISKEPRDYKVTVDFDIYGQKIMYASFAKLVKV